MKALFNDIFHELMFILKGKTLDILIPTLSFYISYQWVSLNVALLIGFIFALGLTLYRILKKEKALYALYGLFGVLLASLLAYINQSAEDYFLPDLMGNLALVTFALLSLIFKRPLAAYASHLMRGWPLPWFWRDDVKPAYQEVTYLWLAFLSLRAIVETVVYLQGDLDRLLIITTLFGIPFFIGILIMSYTYGLWRLNRLNGPSVDEFIEGKEPPFKGQKKGF